MFGVVELQIRLNCQGVEKLIMRNGVCVVWLFLAFLLWRGRKLRGKRASWVLIDKVNTRKLREKDKGTFPRFSKKKKQLAI